VRGGGNPKAELRNPKEGRIRYKRLMEGGTSERRGWVSAAH
jgi:hypothetical protein